MSTFTESANKKHRSIELSGAVLPGAKLSHTNLARANLEGINLVGANLTMSILVGANLKNGNLQGAILAFADLTDCDLTGANLSGANLNKAVFENAILSGTNLRNANMHGANFESAQNVTWYELLGGRINDQTVVPNYLNEASLFETLDGYFDKIAWAEEYSGRLDDLWVDLGKIMESAGEQSISNALINISVHSEMDLKKE